MRGQKTIEATMSQYLVDRIKACKNVDIMQDAEVTAAIGADKLEGVQLKFGGTPAELPAQHLFIFIGASPKVEWLSGSVTTDDRRFIVTGPHLGPYLGPKLQYETSLPGVFAAGDARWDSVKRVAAGVGEGACVIPNVHQWLSKN